MKLTKTIITCLILLLALGEGPLIYYYSNGFWGFVILYPYLILGFVLSLVFVIKIKHKQTNTRFILIGGVVGILLGFISLFSEGAIEFLDWTLRKKERNEIVDRIKQGSSDILTASYFPPISNSSNRLNIQKFDDHTVLVEFYINSGFLDHYSAFSYTNNSDELLKFEQYLSIKKEGFKKLDNNWYRVSY